MKREREAGRRPSAVVVDDIVLPFQAERSGVMGRLVRLGPAVHDVLTRHDYPAAVSEVLGQALALAAMVGSTLREGAQLILQTQTDGPLRLLVVNYEQPGHFRGYARYDGERVARVAAGDTAALLGRGHLGLTIDMGPGAEPYQGIVALDGETLVEAAHIYFQRSAQLPTYIRLAVARHYAAGPAHGTTWRAGGLMVQHLSPERGDEFKSPAAALAVDDPWERTRILAATVEDHELLDPMLSSERLLYRLFHEEGARVYATLPIAMRCRCSRQRVERMLRMFSRSDLDDMREADGSLSVTCEFCRSEEQFAKLEIDALQAAGRRA
jgi:molecular chaperone Hsp33